MPAQGFAHPLSEGVIKSRPNRFIMLVKSGGSLVKCHCPSTGRIGDIIFENIPCLLSKAETEGRKTKYTVEAISLDPPGRKNKTWIGINQTKANDYVYFFLKHGRMPRLVKKGVPVEREKQVGDSRLDFVAGTTFIEVKTPLISLPSRKGLAHLKPSKFTSFERLIRHFTELAKHAKKGARAIVLLCYLYDAKPFVSPKPDCSSVKIQNAVRKATAKGVENWQVNLKIDRNGIRMISYFRLDLWAQTARH